MILYSHVPIIVPGDCSPLHSYASSPYYVLSLLPQGEYTEANEMFARVAGTLEKYRGGDDLELAYTLNLQAMALILQVLSR